MQRKATYFKKWISTVEAWGIYTRNLPEEISLVLTQEKILKNFRALNGRLCEFNKKNYGIPPKTLSGKFNQVAVDYADFYQK